MTEIARGTMAGTEIGNLDSLEEVPSETFSVIITERASKNSGLRADVAYNV